MNELMDENNFNKSVMLPFEISPEYRRHHVSITGYKDLQNVK